MTECDHALGHEIEDNSLVEWYECANCEATINLDLEEVQS